MKSGQKTCFVLMPFADGFREVYEKVYRRVCEENGIRCWRVDERLGPGSITRDIVEGILEADIVIADLTGRNPNVFYELGIAHSAGNKTIMTAQSLKDVPFDIASYRVIEYEQTISGAEKLADDLARSIDALMATLERTNNPVQDALHGRSIRVATLRQPIISTVRLSSISTPLRRFIEEKRLKYVDELFTFDWSELLQAEGLGKTSVEQFLYVLLKLNPTEAQIEQINDFALEHRLDPTWRGGWHVSIVGEEY